MLKLGQFGLGKEGKNILVVWRDTDPGSVSLHAALEFSEIRGYSQFFSFVVLIH